LSILASACAQRYDDVLVLSVLGGATLQLENGEIVRLIGVDCPELRDTEKLNQDAQRMGVSVATLQSCAVSAQEFTRQLVEGKRVRLEFGQKRRDDRGKLVAYVFLSDGIFVNGKILENGYGFYSPYPSNRKYETKLEYFSRTAREERRGMFAMGEFEKRAL